MKPFSPLSTLTALYWCQRHHVTLKFPGVRVCLTLPSELSFCADTLPEAVKAAKAHLAWQSERQEAKAHPTREPVFSAGEEG